MRAADTAALIRAHALVMKVLTAFHTALVTALTAAFSLAIGVATLGVVGIAGAVLMAVFVPRYVASRPGQGAS